MLALWNSLPGVQLLKGFKIRKIALSRIWSRISAGAVAGPTPTRHRPDTEALICHARANARDLLNLGPIRKTGPPNRKGLLASAGSCHSHPEWAYLCSANIP